MPSGDVRCEDKYTRRSPPAHSNEFLRLSKRFYDCRAVPMDVSSLLMVRGCPFHPFVHLKPSRLSLSFLFILLRRAKKEPGENGCWSKVERTDGPNVGFIEGLAELEGSVTSLYDLVFTPYLSVSYFLVVAVTFLLFCFLVTRTAQCALYSPVIYVTFVLQPAATVLVPINKLPRIRSMRPVAEG